MKLGKIVRKAILSRWDRKSPLLLGYSGGGDSKALLYALLEADIREIHLAHVDHGWREESEQEAEQLHLEANALGLVFHTRRLTGRPSRNLEEHGRNARLAFFQELFEKIPFQALLLAHHADDAAETALKRVLEGAHLCHLHGMRQYGRLEGIEVWRPLLKVPKYELTQFIQEKGLSFFVDQTNKDRRFLRGRLRVEIIPFLEAAFGKKICKNLQLLSERSQELQIYLEEKVQNLWDSASCEAARKSLNLNGVDRLIVRHLFQTKMGISFSREQLDILLNAQQKGSKVPVTKDVVMQRGVLSWVIK